MNINPRRVAASLLALTILICKVGEATAAEPDKKDLVPATDFQAASQAFSIDLGKLPQSRGQLVAGLAPDVAALIRDALNNHNISKSVDRFITRIAEKLPTGSGMLLRIRVISDELGHNSLPANFLLPVGAGINPTEAYAEFVNRPTITAPTPFEAAFTETGYFIWIEKGADKLVLASNIPSELTTRLQRDGQKLAAEKVRLRAMGNPVQTFMVPDYVARAEYWLRLMQERRSRFDSEERARAATALTQRFSELQLENSRLFSLYKERQRELSEMKALLGSMELLLDLAGTVASNEPQRQRASFDYAGAKNAVALLGKEIDELDRMQRKNKQDIKSIDDMLVRIPELM